MHLQCHFGIDTLSWARLGARVTGADFSETAIATATSLADELGLEARFVCSDIYKLPDVLDGEFDIVYASRGVIGWLPDLPGWMRVAAHFLRAGGIFYMNEVHPVAQVWNDTDEATELDLVYPYFERDEPMTFEVEGSYADRDAEIKQRTEYAWAHSLGEIVTAAVDAGLRIELLQEFPFLEWPSPFLEERDGKWWLPANEKGELPFSFSLKARKDRAD